MKNLNLDLTADDRPKYLQIADSLRKAIREGRVKPGESIPSCRELAEFTRTHRHTVMAALAELAAEGWLEGKEKQAFRVSQGLPTQYLSAAPARAKESDRANPKAIQGGGIRIVRRVEPRTDSPVVGMKHNFQSGIPDLRLFPTHEFKGHLSEAIRSAKPSHLAYGDPAGHAPLIEEISSYLRRMRSITDRSTLITHGSQEGIYLTSQLLLEPGDRVAVEELGYPPAWESFKQAGAELVPIRVEEDGLDPDHLEKALKRRKIRLIYTTPLHQYPTTVTLSVSKRLRLYELADRYGVPILEDDYDHEFHYRCQPLAPLAGEDRAGWVIYVSTFSKILFPAIRLGFMSVPSQLAGPLAELRKITTRQNDFITQDAVARWMREGGFERHLRKMRRTYEERRDAMVSCMDAFSKDGVRLSLAVPDGGMAVWVDTDRDSARLAESARKKGIYLMHEQAFRLDQRPGTHLRLGFASQTPAEIRQGLRQVFQSV